MSSGLLEFQKMALRRFKESKKNKDRKFSDLFEDIVDVQQGEIDPEEETTEEVEELDSSYLDDFNYENLANQEPSFAYADVEINDDNIYDAYDSVVNDLNIMIAKYSILLDKQSEQLDKEDRSLDEYKVLLNKYEDLMGKYGDLMDKCEDLLDSREDLMYKLDKAYDRIEELEDELGY